MQLIKFKLSGANGKNLGSFTLDPLAQISLMAFAKSNKQTMAEVACDLLRETLPCEEDEIMKEASEELEAA